jgi:sorbitol-specific phosphotransferase system component IIBC
MNANELADYITENSYIGTVTMEDVATMLRQQHAEIDQQQAEIEGMRNRFTLAFWHDTFVEVKKPNSDLIYRFKLDETNDS